MSDEKKFTDADLQAAGAAGALAMQKMICGAVKARGENRARLMESDHLTALHDTIARDIAALPLPNPDALAAAVAEAVGKERVWMLAWADEYEALVKKHGQDPYRDVQIATLSTLRDAIRTRPTGGGSGT